MFKLNHRFEEDSIFVTKLELCQVRLQNDARFPWFILIPEVEGVEEVDALSVSQQHVLIDESSKVSAALRTVVSADKINVANLGNIVRQLHWHVVARTENDVAWPGPIWGVGTAEKYEDKKRVELIDSFLTALNK
ncbi:HIT domain-containing protein [Psychrosphaera sp. B3R10]|uniref:HIT domain-containing protein n=1 Tax=unclassified Psychrosphaera TaxID=2641570 RepID=UPI001C0A20DA|nr:MULTISPECIES: HIT domain-containing protein [unclassified Psychrosphaera]MBU2880586.1 HIT domain-containing protein [Psychrosphaera sp. I2R16]MBU2990672.1 HIT domain-containing protein [Psychrosphaera sp. B3R10]